MPTYVYAIDPIEPCRRVFGYDYTNRKNRLNTKI